jgi:hypothetical protein
LKIGVPVACEATKWLVSDQAGQYRQKNDLLLRNALTALSIPAYY